MEFVDVIPNVCDGLPFKRGDFVLLNLWGEEKDNEVVNLLSQALSFKGVVTFKHSCSKSLLTDTVSVLAQKGVEFPDSYFSFLTSFKHVIDIFMYSPKIPEGLTEEGVIGIRKFIRKLFSALSADKEYYIQLRVPTLENSQESGMEYDCYRDMICNALSVDFPALKSSCLTALGSHQGENKISIHTGNGFILNMNIENRMWHIDDGCGDLPAGEIYIAPHEDSADGNIYFTELYFEGQLYKEVIMSFENGRLKACNCSEINDFFKSTPEEFTILSEFGIGLNPNVKELTGYTPIDEKALGTYHIALGMNNMFGGQNACPFHMDFVFRSDSVYFD